MKDFAKGVKVFPAGYDALDFTRAVHYCLDHSEEQWMYPTDYKRLVNHLGPATVETAHQDRAAFSRYTTTKLATGIKNSAGRKRDERGRLQKKGSDDEEENLPDTESDDDSDEEPDFDAMVQWGKKRKTFLDNCSSNDDENFDTPCRKRPAKRAKIAPKPGATRNCSKRTPVPSRLRKALKPENISDIHSESDSELYQGPKKMKKVAGVRRSGRVTKITQSYIIHQDEATYEEDESADEDAVIPTSSDMNSDMSDIGDLLSDED